MQFQEHNPMVAKIATWNVNSLKVRLPQLIEWSARHRPDVVALQETKTEDAGFPRADLEAAGFRCAFAGQKTYNGVALLTRPEPADVTVNIPGFADEQKRVVACTVGDLRLVCAYVPNGQEVGSDKYRYKLDWLAAFAAWLREERARHPALVVMGDFNIAPADEDVHDPRVWEGKVLFSEPEKAAFRALIELGLVDSFRRFEQPAKSFTWWDYRMNAFKRNLGLRIDHILVSPPVAERAVSCTIDVEPRRAERPSDHAPVILTIDSTGRTP
jgi:exodeoxyribonuclease-3